MGKLTRIIFEYLIAILLISSLLLAIVSVVVVKFRVKIFNLLSCSR